MESGVLWHPFKKIGTDTAQLQGVHQNCQASHAATLLYNNSKGQHQVEEPCMWVNLIAESSSGTQLPSGVQCVPAYCTLETGSNRVTVGLRNLSSQSIKIPPQVVVGQLQQATIQKAQASGNQNKQGPPGGGGDLGFGSAEFGGVGCLDRWSAEGSQRSFGWLCWCLLWKQFRFGQV